VKILHELFSESDGKWSIGRVGFAVAMAFALYWVTHLVHVNKTLPDLGGLGVFVGIPYLINKSAAAYENRENNKS
jgi:hypothetical protein